MRAAYYERTGPAGEVLHLSELPDPAPAAGEVRVRVRCSGVNPSDVKSRGGLRSQVMPFPRVIPHSDGTGIVDAVGEGVDRRRIGERVWVWNAAWGRPFGTAAELCCLPQQQAVPLPDGTADEAGACLGIPALTAIHAVMMDGGVAGKRVLVAGGAGAVSHYALQFASRMGAAQILTTVSSAQKAAIAREAGADATIDYRNEPVAERVRELTRGHGVDRVIELDIAANGALDVELLHPGGDIVAYGSSQPVNLPFFPLISKNVQVRFFMVYHLAAIDRERATAALQRYLARNELHHNVALTLRLDRIVEAHEAVEQGRVVGNVVLQVA
ncbi:MAG: NADPH:quinone reductase [Burkholderiaceae bacterium]